MMMVIEVPIKSTAKTCSIIFMTNNFYTIINLLTVLMDLATISRMPFHAVQIMQLELHCNLLALPLLFDVRVRSTCGWTELSCCDGITT